MSTPHEPHDPPHDTDGRIALPRLTTPTWEMELLISGATVFSLLQVPDLLDAAFYTWYPRLGMSATAAVTLPYVYLMAATWALVVTFVLHLVTRARWVALVGLGSVYPEGIEWSKLKLGPAYLDVMRERYPSLAATIERADNTASRVFGFGVAFAMLILAPLLIMTALTLITIVLHEVSGNVFEWLNLWMVVSALAFGPFVLALMIDRYWKRPPSPNVRRSLMRRLLSFYTGQGFSSFSNYPMLLFSSRVGERNSTGILMVAMMALLAAVFVRMVAREDLFQLDGYTSLPSPLAARGHVLDPAFYADQRDGERSMAPQPFIQGEVIEGDYVRLFLPHVPQRDVVAMEKLCPPVLPDFSGDEDDEAGKRAHDEARTVVLLACVGRIYRVALNGEPVAGLRFDLATEDQLGGRGFVTRIDVRDLPRGRHEVAIERVALPEDGDAEVSRKAKQPWLRRIPFWR